MKGLIFDIKRFAVHDGPGIRTTIFFKGCPLSCKWCHNPESKSHLPEKSTKTITLEGQQFFTEQVIGEWLEADELLERVIKDELYYRESNGGITLSGGEPLLQHQFSIAFLKACKVNQLHTAIDTSGYINPSILKEITTYTDLFLYDLKIMDDELHQKFTGVSNKLILSNLELLSQSENQIIIRIPLISGINDNEMNYRLIIDFLKAKTNIIEIHLLPFHNLANEKHKRLKMSNKQIHFHSPTNSTIHQIRQCFESNGYRVLVGG
jgi:pyruvate formate lyase activating enzyme